jgi:hypothetical protein
VYDWPIGDAGLTWDELVDWRSDVAGVAGKSDAANSLHRRLVQSLDAGRPRPPAAVRSG